VAHEQRYIANSIKTAVVVHSQQDDFNLVQLVTKQLIEVHLVKLLESNGF
jgi:hypothetical protein